MLDLLIPQRSAATLTGIPGFSVVEWRLRTKFTLVVRSKHLLRFFQPVHLHGELTNLLCVSSFLFALLGELFFQVLLPGVVKDHRSFLKEFLLPIPEEIRLNVIFGSNDIQFLFSLQNFENEIGFELGTKVSSCTRHVFESSILVF